MTPASFVESKLGGATILNSRADNLISAVRECVKEKPDAAPGIVTAVLKSGRADADAIAPRVTAAAIQGLGAHPSPGQVGAIVAASVKATPAVVLETVRLAVKAAPDCADAIVRAAARSIPNPNEKIETVTEVTSGTRGFSKDESKGVEDTQYLPILEAIAQAALQGDPSLSYPELLAAADPGGSPPGAPFTSTSTYPGYFYPPILTPPTTLPSPAVVSK